MSVVSTLTREHRLFERLLDRLHGAAELGGPAGREGVERVLRVLLPALERHDAIETLIFGEPGMAWEEDERRSLGLVEAQHESVRGLRGEIEAVLRAHERAPSSRLFSLGEALAAKLEWHFKTEELLIWPLHAKRGGRSIGRSIEHAARKSVRDLEDAVSRLPQLVPDRAGDEP